MENNVFNFFTLGPRGDSVRGCANHNIWSHYIFHGELREDSKWETSDLLEFSDLHWAWKLVANHHSFFVAGKFFLFLVFMFLTFTYFTFYGMMAVGLTSSQHLAAVISSAFYSLWNLLSGFLVPKPVSGPFPVRNYLHTSLWFLIMGWLPWPPWCISCQFLGNYSRMNMSKPFD